MLRACLDRHFADGVILSGHIRAQVQRLAVGAKWISLSTPLSLSFSLIYTHKLVQSSSAAFAVLSINSNQQKKIPLTCPQQLKPVKML